MNMTDEVKAFINKLSSDTRFTPTVDLIKQDLSKCNTDIINMILQRRIKLPDSWSGYVVTDIDIIYEEDVLNLHDLLSMYGLITRIPQLYSGDTGITAIYRFDSFDAYENIVSTVHVYHITINCTYNNDTFNEWFIMYN